jgi:glycosyltransferase involved in cell wall biosynthesis
MFQVPSISVPLYKEYKFAVPGPKFFEDSLKEFRPDILHINSPCPLGHAAVRYGQKNNIPVVATYHTHFPSYAKYYKVKALENLGWNYLRSLYNKCEAVYVPSLPIMKELKAQGLEKIQFLPHGVDTETFNPEFNSPHWKENIGCKNKKVVLYAGRLVWEKDLKVLADACRIITSKRDDTVFVIVGDGPIRAELQNLMPNAIFLGFQSGINLSTAYASSDVFAFPSTTETFGNVTVEAMASGIPPVCAREGGAFGIINDGITGLIAEPHNAESLAENILLLLENKSFREELGFNALQYSRTQTWNVIISNLLESYNKIINSYKKVLNYKITNAA